MPNRPKQWNSNSTGGIVRGPDRPPPGGGGWSGDGVRFGLGPLLVTALVVGVVTGLGALLFRDMISFVHNLFFLGRLSLFYDSSLFTPVNPWGPLVVLVPVAGAIGVTFIVSNFAPEAKGHGVPEVMDAIYYQGGLVRPVVAVAKSLASALAIGTGAAVGREGPIIQIGAALGSTFGQILAISPGQRITLVAAGAGAGIAATFNTPIGGVLFAIELMLPEVSVNTFLPVAVATGTATFIGRLFFGAAPAFHVPSLTPLPNDLAGGTVVLLLYVVLGGVMGVAAAAFIHVLHAAEDLFDLVPGLYLRHAFGMLLVGALIYGLWAVFGHYFIEGVGYATIQAVLANQTTGIGLLMLLFLCKLAATSISLGSGSSGGIFSPSLFMGATLGGGFAGLIATAFPSAPISMPAFAMVGMGAMVGGGTGAAVTAVTMVFEMTRDYDIVLPMILAVAASLGTRRLLSRENIYSAKLVRRGHAIPRGLHANLFLVRSAGQIMDRNFVKVPASTRLDEFLRQSEGSGLKHLVVMSGDRISGVVRINTGLRQKLANSGAAVTVGEVAQRNYAIVRDDDAAFDVITRLWRKGAAMALVVRTRPEGLRIPRVQDIVGVITKEHVADSVASAVRIYPG